MTFNVMDEVAPFFDESSLSGENKPKLVVIAGGVCAGKTYLRKTSFTPGYVVLDAAEIFLSLSRGEYFEFGEMFEKPLNMIGNFVAWKAINERRNIVMEIIGADPKIYESLSGAAKLVGYDIKLHGVYCEIADAIERNLNRGEDNISAHFCEPYHIRWITEAAKENALY